MQPGDLTTLAAAKAWMGETGSGSDSLIGALITAASVSVANHLGRGALAVTTRTETYDVTRAEFLLLRNWPVISVSAVNLIDATITTNSLASWPPVSGFVLTQVDGERPAKLALNGYAFTPGVATAQVVYTAGYQVSGEAHSVPAAGPYTVSTSRTSLGDVSVAYASGAALVAVPGAPTLGQYSVANGVYTFSSSDANAAVLITYSAPPAPIEQAVWEIVGEAYKRKDRAGQSSKTIPGQGTIAFSQLPLNHAAEMLLCPYRRV